jgi:hypothetical protein
MQRTHPAHGRCQDAETTPSHGASFSPPTYWNDDADAPPHDLAIRHALPAFQQSGQLSEPHRPGSPSRATVLCVNSSGIAITLAPYAPVRRNHKPKPAGTVRQTALNEDRDLPLEDRGRMGRTVAGVFSTRWLAVW